MTYLKQERLIEKIVELSLLTTILRVDILDSIDSDRYHFTLNLE